MHLQISFRVLDATLTRVKLYRLCRR